MASGGHSSSRCAGLSLSRPLLLRSTGSRRAGSVIVAHGPSCSAACGIFPDQGSNPCPLHWQADSQPLRHQGSPKLTFMLIKLFLTNQGSLHSSLHKVTYDFFASSHCSHRKSLKDVHSSLTLIRDKDIFFFCIFFFINLFLFLAALGLRFCARASSSCGKRGPLSSLCAGLSLSRPLLLRSTGSRRTGSVVVAHGPSCSAACGILPDQGSNSCPLHWQADSQPLHHQGSPLLHIL